MSLEETSPSCPGYFLIDARGTIIKIPITVAKMIPLFNAYLERWSTITYTSGMTTPYYINQSANSIHALIDQFEDSAASFTGLEDKKSDEKPTTIYDMFDDQLRLKNELFDTIIVKLLYDKQGCTGYISFNNVCYTILNIKNMHDSIDIVFNHITINFPCSEAARVRYHFTHKYTLSFIKNAFAWSAYRIMTTNQTDKKD